MFTVDVFLICALKDEYDQVLKVTDGLQDSGWNEHPLTSGWIVADADFLTVTCGILRVRATHASHMGREQVQAVASKLIFEQHAQCIAMSGICAGRRGKVSLGDVIFAERLWSYDAGKITVEDGVRKFHGDPIQYNPSRVWVQRMQHLPAPSASASWLSLRPRLSLEYQEDWALLRVLAGEEPNQHSDFHLECPNWSDVLQRLWKRKWLEKPLKLTDTGRKYVEELALLYPNKLPEPCDFRIHVAPMATGAAVTEDAGVFPRLGDSMRKVLGIEMEASALGALSEVQGIPVVVAKGVSDYGDSFKDDRYREFAARASAELLIALLRNSADLLPKQNSPNSSGSVKLSSQSTVCIHGTLVNNILAKEYQSSNSIVTTRSETKASKIECDKDGNNVSEYLREQSNAFLNETLLPWARTGIGSFKMLWPELVIPAPIREQKEHIHTTFQQWIDLRQEIPNTVVVGKAGSGKSITLKYLFLSLAEKYKNHSNTVLPIYTHAVDLVHTHRDVRKTITQLTKDANRLLFLIDGIDEVPLEDGKEIVDKWRKEFEIYGGWVFAMRDEHFYSHYKHLRDFDVATGAIVEMLDWSASNAKSFLTSYLAKIRHEKIEEKIVNNLVDNSDLREFVSNPFQLILLLYLLIQDTQFDLVEPNKFALYSEFYSHWMSREGHRFRRDNWDKLSNRIAQAHQHLALRAYVERREKSFAQVYYSLNFDKEIQCDASFADLLSDKYSAISLKTSKSGFFHQSILEYFVSRSVVCALLEGEGIPDILSEEFNIEINTFLRGAFSVLETTELLQAAGRAKSMYDTLLSRQIRAAKQRKSNEVARNRRSRRAFRAREQLVYLLGRMPDNRSANAVSEIYLSEPHPLIKRAAALGAILHGNTEVENDYMGKLENDPSEAVLNRSVQLVYFGDVDESIFDFRDNGVCAWERTRCQIINRLSESSKRAELLRWWDIATLHSFFVSRVNSNGLSADEMEILNCVLNIVSAENSKRAKKIENLIRYLLINHSG